MEMALRAPEFWKAAGFENADRFSLDRMNTDYGISYMRFLDPEDELDHWGYNIEITETGSVLYMSALPWQRYENWLEHEQPIDLEITDEMIERITGFLAQVNPEVHFSKLIAIGQYVFDDAVFLELADENYEEAELPLLFVVQVSPEWKIVHYTCIGNG